MREILFRGKSAKDGKWFTGQLLHFKSPVSEKELNIIVEGCEWDDSNEWFNIGRRTKVVPETVGQYTGFDDKNGKKVFEGDILKAEIWWEQGGCYPHTETRFIEATFPNMYKNHFEKFEVVGNIYDNPELLRR